MRFPEYRREFFYYTILYSRAIVCYATLRTFSHRGNSRELRSYIYTRIDSLRTRTWVGNIFRRSYSHLHLLLLRHPLLLPLPLPLPLVLCFLHLPLLPLFTLLKDQLHQFFLLLVLPLNFLPTHFDLLLSTLLIGYQTCQARLFILLYFL